MRQEAMDRGVGDRDAVGAEGGGAITTQYRELQGEEPAPGPRPAVHGTMCPKVCHLMPFVSQRPPAASASKRSLGTGMQHTVQSG